MFQKCKVCGNKFKYKDIFSLIWSFNGHSEFTCKKCLATYKVRYLSRILIGLAIALPLILVSLIPDIIINNVIISSLIYISFIILISPFMVLFVKQRSA